MLFRNFKYYIKQTFKDLYMHRFMAFTSIVTIFSCVLILVVSYTLSSNINYFMSKIENEVNFAIFVNNDIEPDEVSKMYTDFANNPNIEDVQYISKKAALASLKEDYGDNSNFLDGLEDDNPLPRSFVVSLKDYNYSQEFLENIEARVGEDKEFSSVRHAQLETDILINIKNIINAISVVLLVILSFIDVVIIMNTIKMGIELRRQEINIMRYIGATKSFIRIPFIMQGAFVGAVGGSIPPLLLLVFYNKIVDTIYEKAPILLELVTFKTSTDIFSEVFVVAIGFGVALGILASILSIRKYLKA
ncbi:MAG: permease-like cell division protein FtsX [Lachnospirales bacterium]